MDKTPNKYPNAAGIQECELIVTAMTLCQQRIFNNRHKPLTRVRAVVHGGLGPTLPSFSTSFSSWSSLGCSLYPESVGSDKLHNKVPISKF